MKRAGRWLFNFAVGLATLLFLLTTTFWWRSYYVDDHISKDSAEGNRAILSSRSGALIIVHSVNAFSVGRPTDRWSYVQMPPEAVFRDWSNQPALKSRWQFGGFGVLVIGRADGGFGRPVIGPWRTTNVVVPYWAMAGAAISLPAIWIARRRRIRAMTDMSLCPICGYDLRATPDRCPECGAIPPAAKGTAT